MLDLRFLGRRKMTAAIAIATVALAIGANTAVLSVVEAFLWSSLGVPAPDRLLVVAPQRNLAGRGTVIFGDAYPNYQLLRATQHAFADVATFIQLQASWDDHGEARSLSATRATASFFSTTRVQPALGRAFTAGEEGPSPAPVVVISHGLWVSAFGGDPSILGRSITLNGAPHTVIGVMPQGFAQPQPNDVWLPFDVPAAQRTAITGARQLGMYARLADGMTFDAANRELDQFTKRAVAESPADNKDYRYSATTLRANLLAGADSSALFVQAGAALLLLLATLNLASVFLAWGLERKQEMAVRVALGASDRRVAWLLLQQSLIVVGLGAIAGVVGAFGALRMLQQLDLGPTVGVFLGGAQLDARVLLISALMAAATAVLAGALPAWFSRGDRLGMALRTSSRSATSSPAAVRWQKAIVVSQTALCTTILAAAVLMAVSFWKLSRIPDGFVPSDRVVARVVLPDASYGTHAARAAFGQALAENLAGEPELRGVAFTSTLPVGDGTWGARFLIELPDGSVSKEPLLFHFRRVSTGYLSTMGIPLMRGRAFTTEDNGGSVPVALVSRALAARLWPNEEAVGKRLLRVGAGTAAPAPVTIVGVVGDVMDGGYSAPAGEAVYVPYAQLSMPRLSIVGISRGNTAAAIAAIRRALRKTDPMVAASSTTSLDALVLQANTLPRLRTEILALFAIVAAGIVALGSYGLMTQMVGVRERELAVRLAFGARPHQLGVSVIAQAAWLTLPGICMGLAGAWLASGLLDGFVFGVASRSPAVLAGAGAGLVLLAGLAIVSPTIRAMRVDMRRGLTG